MTYLIGFVASFSHSSGWFTLQSSPSIPAKVPHVTGYCSMNTTVQYGAHRLTYPTLHFLKINFDPNIAAFFYSTAGLTSCGRTMTWLCDMDNLWSASFWCWNLKIFVIWEVFSRSLCFTEVFTFSFSWIIHFSFFSQTFAAWWTVTFGRSWLAFTFIYYSFLWSLFRLFFRRLSRCCCWLLCLFSFSCRFALFSFCFFALNSVNKINNYVLIFISRMNL